MDHKIRLYFDLYDVNLTGKIFDAKRLMDQI